MSRSQHPSCSPLPQTVALIDQAQARVRDILDATGLKPTDSYPALLLVLSEIHEAAMAGPSYSAGERMAATVNAWLETLG